MNATEISLAVSVLAVAIAGSLNDEDLHITATAFEQLSKNLEAIAIYRAIEKKEDIDDILEELVD